MNEFPLVQFLICAWVIVSGLLFFYKKADSIKGQPEIWRNGIKERKLPPILSTVVFIVLVLLLFLKERYKNELAANSYLLIAFLVFLAFMRLMKNDNTDDITGDCIKCKKTGKLFHVGRGIGAGYYCLDCYAVIHNQEKRMLFLFFISVVIVSVALVVIVIYLPGFLDRIWTLLN